MLGKLLRRHHGAAADADSGSLTVAQQFRTWERTHPGGTLPEFWRTVGKRQIAAPALAAQPALAEADVVGYALMPATRPYGRGRDLRHALR